MVPRELFTRHFNHTEIHSRVSTQSHCVRRRTSREELSCPPKSAFCLHPAAPRSITHLQEISRSLTHTACAGRCQAPAHLSNYSPGCVGRKKTTTWCHKAFRVTLWICQSSVSSLSPSPSGRPHNQSAVAAGPCRLALWDVT